MLGKSIEIWIVSQSYLPHHGGITEHVWNLAAALARRGHRATIVTGGAVRKRPARHPDACSPRDFEPPNMDPDPPGCDPDPPGVEVVRLGRTIRVPSHGSRACVTLGCDAWSRRGLLRKRPAPDIVHVQSPLEPFLPLAILRSAPGIKIGTFHTGGSRDHWGYRLFAPALASDFARLRARIAVSEEAARFASVHFPGRYEIIPNGVDVARFAHPDRAEAAAGEEVDGGASSAKGSAGLARGHGRSPTILFVGRLEKRKGLRILLEACDRMGKQTAASGRGGPLVRIVGEGPERAGLERLAARLGVRATFDGPVARESLPRCYASADLFAATSTDGESFGVSLLEAMASGLPIVASDLPGYRQTLAGSGAALFFRAGSADDLARSLARLSEDPAMRCALGRAGRRFVRKYDWDAIARRVEGLYRAALDGEMTGREPRSFVTDSSSGFSSAREA